MVCWRDSADAEVRLFCRNHGREILRPLRADLLVALNRFGSLPVKMGGDGVVVALFSPLTPLAFPVLLVLPLMLLLLLLVADIVLLLHFLKKLNVSFESFVFVGVSRIYFNVRFGSSSYKVYCWKLLRLLEEGNL